jgi:hypothetical protein
MSFENYRRPFNNPLNPFVESIDIAAAAIADGISSSLSETLSDPIIRQVMAADHVEPAGLRTLLLEAAARLRGRCQQPC